MSDDSDKEVEELFRTSGEDDLDGILLSDSESDEDDISPSTGVEPQVNSEDEEPPAKQRRRNFSKKFINSSDSALNQNKYNILDLSDIEKKQFKVVLEKQSSKSFGHNITWTNDPPASYSGRLTARNIISGPVGVRNKAKQCNTPIAAWELFFSANILIHIVEMSNKKISSVRSALNEKILYNSRYSFLGFTTFREILAFVGLMYFRDLMGLANHDVKVLYEKRTANDIFSATMSKNRFRFLFANITFDNHVTRNQLWKSDWFAGFRDVFEWFVSNCSKYVIPDDYICLDETLYPTQVSIAFRQYNPKKLARYGMLFKSINACRYPYTFTSFAYAGKPRNYDSQPCKYYVRGTEETVKTMVKNLLKSANLSGRNLTYDRIILL